MEKTTTLSRIHPLMAGAALSVIAVSLAGTAAITGLLPNSKAEPSATAQAAFASSAAALAAPAALAPLTAAPAAPLAAAPAAPTAQQLAEAQMLVAKYSPQTVQPQAPVVEYEKPVVKKVVHAKPRPVQHTRVVYRDAPNYRAQPVQQARQPNYLGIGAGAVIGGLIGNQVGGGNGKKLATVAGVIGGGMLGNEIANRNR